ncbi:MAG: type II toxin-antitoxin system RelB/DinJ family antitoxin [Candidatus Peribacteraceae bacterium]|nr:type II toxin-antitoxin system RelB/DinJ family antitoxin [Candidatus Peribacteraceae bacterium]MBP9850939.1 type II toxin-antitoxin system RelB/DinJ family antitoxin [Candidatus Peribacteraceae bacterium]
MATIQVRVPDKNKKNVEKILASLGLDVSTAVRMFLCRVELDQGLPFRVSKKLTVNGFTPEFEAEVLEAMKDTEDSIKFDNSDDAVAYLRKMAQ